MKSALTLLTSLMVTGLVTPTLALSNGTRSNPIDPFSQGQGIIVADTWDDYRDRRHRELDQQINNEVNRPHNSRLSQKDKERIIKDAHRELDKRLDAEEKEWRRRYANDRDRYNIRSNSGRYDDRRDNRRYDDRYDDRRYDNRSNDREIRERYRNFDQYNSRDRRSNDNNRDDLRNPGRINDPYNRNIYNCSPQNPYDCYDQR
ncbi:MAG: hypothetical protein HC825_08645 [Oscillatoriales cyanobacterium RM1_1_9]|nr:hypothetical protein [Oscillatoriales cyanobacterium RM1_1_9]